MCVSESLMILAWPLRFPIYGLPRLLCSVANCHGLRKMPSPLRQDS